ncbi:MAG: hypothetical protein IPM06_15345 [Rhizobiales bacterium]|nr:hypothetical protein [Hyphomicrobiales bacterium]
MSFIVRLMFVVISLATCLTTARADDSVPGNDSIAIFAGQATWTNFVESMYAPWRNDMADLGVVGLAYSHRFGSVNDITGGILPPVIGDHLFVEGEVGGSFRFGDEDLGEGWAAAYLRYDNLPWNDYVYTTIAVNTGVSYLTETSEFERSRDSKSEAAKLLHYMGPEITFANPENKNLELLVRYHHRSGVFGLFDDVVSGSTFITAGLRYRF